MTLIVVAFLFVALMVRAMQCFVLIIPDPVLLDAEARAIAEAQALEEEERRSDEFLARLLDEAERIKDQ